MSSGVTEHLPELPSLLVFPRVVTFVTGRAIFCSYSTAGYYARR